jgi:hypothetical protein
VGVGHESCCVCGYLRNALRGCSSSIRGGAGRIETACDRRRDRAAGFQRVKFAQEGQLCVPLMNAVDTTNGYTLEKAKVNPFRCRP